MAASSRFYRDVSVSRGEDGSYSILLDGKPIRTPAGAAFRVPSDALAEAVAAEWRAQGDKIRPETMMLTKLANTAIDRVAPDRTQVVDQVLAFARSDLVCYRAPGPDELVQRQARGWDSLLEWVRVRFGAALVCTVGIGFVAQPEEALSELEKAIAAADDFTLAGIHSAATVTGSVVIGLALAGGLLGPDEAFAAAELDEIFQAERWGQDQEALERSHKKKNELTEIARFFKLASEIGNAS